MSRSVVLALFDGVDAAAAAAAALRALPIAEERITTISSVPLPDGAVARDVRPIRFPRLVVSAWFAGAIAGLSLALYTYLDYPLVTAGKPIISVPPTLIITYEVAMLFALVATLVLGFREMGLPRWRTRKVHDPRIHQGKIAVLAEVEGEEQALRAKEALQRAGGSDARVEEGVP